MQLPGREPAAERGVEGGAAAREPAARRTACRAALGGEPRDAMAQRGELMKRLADNVLYMFFIALCRWRLSRRWALRRFISRKGAKKKISHKDTKRAVAAAASLYLHLRKMGRTSSKLCGHNRPLCVFV